MHRSRMVPLVLLAALVLALVLSGGCLDSFLPLGERADYPSIDDVGISEGTIPVHHTFPFQDREIALDLDVEKDLYTDAVLSRKSVVLYGEWDSDEEWLGESYRAFVGDSRLGGMYGSLRSAFLDIRKSMELDDDEYVELMAAYVQSMTYESPEGEQTPRFPVETIVEGKGDCDDTSILLAGLLEREGYDTVLLYFEEESHMAVGVRGAGAGFMGTGYEYIETTDFSLPGVATENLQNGMALVSEPFLIPIGEGSRVYTAGEASRRIDAAADLARAYATGMETDLADRESVINARYDELSAVRTELEDAGSAGNADLYNRLVQEHNSLVGDYNRLLADYDLLFADYEAYAVLNNYIAEWKETTGLPLAA